MIFLSGIVGMRDVSVGKDTNNYINFFYSIVEVIDGSRLEVLFKYITYGVSLIGGGHELYFAVLFLIFNLSYLYFYYRISAGQSGVIALFLLVGFLLSSSWYAVATTNGLRQGLSLPFLYLSLFFFSERKVLLSSLFFVISLGFHMSVILFLPFYILFFLRIRVVFSAFLIMAGLYLLNFFEPLVMAASNYFSLNAYEIITNYASGSGRWVGVQFEFVMYTVFFGTLFYFLRKYVKRMFLSNYDRVLKFYYLLMMPYFSFGFGAYSNRYAFIGWLFLPAIQTFFIISSRFDRSVKLLASLVLFIFGLFSYLSLVLGLIN